VVTHKHRHSCYCPPLFMALLLLQKKNKTGRFFVHPVFQRVRVPDIHRAYLRSNFRSGVTKRRELSARLMSVGAAPQEQKQAASLLFRIYPAVFLSFECVVSVKRDKYANVISTPYAQIIIWRKTYRYIFSSDIEMYVYLKRLLPSLPLRIRTRRGRCCPHLARTNQRTAMGEGRCHDNLAILFPACEAVAFNSREENSN